MHNVRIAVVVIGTAPDRNECRFLASPDGWFPSVDLVNDSPLETAAKLFEELTGFKARTGPMEPGWVELVLVDASSSNDDLAITYATIIPATDPPADPHVIWAELERLHSSETQTALSALRCV